jgi:Lrp/AsnC family transcriptional regulator of lysine biosynthesis
MDEIDEKILGILKRDSRTKYVKMAEIIGWTEGAMRMRVKKLLEQGIINKFTIETKVEVEGIILVKTDPNETRNVVLKMKEVSEKIFEVSGDYDVAALIQAYTITELNKKVDKIRALPAVLNTNTLVKLASNSF